MEVDGASLKEEAAYTDACAGDGETTDYSDDTSVEGQLKRTFTATDGCNESTCTVTYTWEIEEPCDSIIFVSNCWTVTYNLTGTDGDGYAEYSTGYFNDGGNGFDYYMYYDEIDGRWEAYEGSYLAFVSYDNSKVPSIYLAQWQDYTNCSPLVDILCGDVPTTAPSYSQYYNYAHNEESSAEAAPDMGVELDFMAYPVPFDRDVNVKFNFEFDTDVTIEVHDTRGLLVKSMTLNNVRANTEIKKSFDLSRAGDQLFYITVTTNQGSVTKKAVSSNMKRR